MTMNAKMCHLRSFDELKMDDALNQLRESIYGKHKFETIRQQMRKKKADKKELDHYRNMHHMLNVKDFLRMGKKDIDQKV